MNGQHHFIETDPIFGDNGNHFHDGEFHLSKYELAKVDLKVMRMQKEVARKDVQVRRLRRKLAKREKNHKWQWQPD